MAELNIPDGLPSLSHGSHHPNTQHACIMELVSMIAGEPWSDQPRCVNPFLRSAAICVNDTLADEHRHLLMPLLGRFFGTNKTEVSRAIRSHLSGGRVRLDGPSADSLVTMLFQQKFTVIHGHIRDLRRAQAEVDWLSGLLDVAEAALKNHQPREITEQDVVKVHEAMHV